MQKINQGFRHILTTIPILLFLTVPVIISAQDRTVSILTTDWKFAPGTQQNAQAIDFNDAKWQPISVPHDWAIAGPFIVDGNGDTGKLPWKGEGWYRRKLEIPKSAAGKRIYLLFDGVMAFPKVYVNGQLAGKWDYGYNSFYVDITSFVQPGQSNTLAVHADTRPHDSRWYPGAGIYRKVSLITMDPIHVDLWGMQVYTPIIKSNYAQVEVNVQVVNQSPTQYDEIQVVYTLISPSGKAIAEKEVSGRLTANGERSFETSFILNHPQRWEVGKGTLYSIRAEVRRGKTIVDRHTERFGIRSMRFTADDGFYVNDQRVQLKGVNLHHDHGPLGAAFNRRAMQRQLELLVDMGCNAVRNSHNVAAPELLDLCDSMGILVLDEIFDKYDAKADITDTTHFDAFVARNVGNFIRRDRNHPCVFLWSVGNEIGDVQWNHNGGFDKLRKMVNEVRRHDHTRPVTLVCDSRNSATLRHFDYYDVHSWNYGRRYDLARQLEPNKSVIISESASTVSTRGFYEWPLPVKKTDFTKSLQVSSYDLNAPDWAEISDDDFMWQQEENYVAGEFVWTGFDYLGEPTPYNNDAVKKLGMDDKAASVSSYFGILDLVGIPKDRYYLYKSYWKPEDTTVHILPHWNWQGMEGKNIPVFVYTNGDCAELFLNGKSLGMECKDPASSISTERFRLMWMDVPYTPGELKAVAYREGEYLGESIIQTTGAPTQLRLSPDRNVIRADGQDLSYVLIEALDQNGLPNPLADIEVILDVKGAGRIAGVGNGNPQSMASFQSSKVKLFYGKAMLILQSTDSAGAIDITASSQGLTSATVRIQTQ